VTIASMLDELKRQHASSDELTIPNDRPAVPEIPLPQAASAEPTPASVALAGPTPILSAEDLYSLAAMHGWEALPIRPGERAGGSQKHWRAFTGWATGPVLARASRAAWECWRSTVEHYAELMGEPRIAALFAGGEG
jgi:hypothetical protein